jgi:hypothetical protein
MPGEALELLAASSRDMSIDTFRRDMLHAVGEDGVFYPIIASAGSLNGRMMEGREGI